LARPGSPLRPHLPHRPTAGGASVILNYDGRPTRPQHSRTATAISDTEATLVQAAKVLKRAVLHDARNIKGRPTDLSTLAWDINSTQEAKVCSFISSGDCLLTIRSVWQELFSIV
jgi:hypothetical protein